MISYGLRGGEKVKVKNQLIDGIFGLLLARCRERYWKNTNTNKNEQPKVIFKTIFWNFTAGGEGIFPIFDFKLFWCWAVLFGCVKPTLAIDKLQILHSKCQNEPSLKRI